MLHPLLTKTQLHSLPYKRPQIVQALESLIANQEIRDVNPTTKRLVERCLSGEWCVQHRKPSSARRVFAESGMERTSSPSSDSVAAQSLTPKLLSVPGPPTTNLSLSRRRSLKGSRSAEDLRGLAAANEKLGSRALEAFSRTTNDGSLALNLTPNSASVAPHHNAHQHRTGSEILVDKRPADRRIHTREVTSPVRHNSLGTMIDEVVSPRSPSGAVAVRVSPPPSPVVPASVRNSDARVPPSPAGSTASGTKKVQRRPPPPPPKRRKPPAVPMRVVGTSNSGAKIAAIASSMSAPA